MKVAQELSYKGYRLLVSPVGKGWRAMIFPPGSSSALPESPATLEKRPKESIVDEEKKISDARVKEKNSRSAGPILVCRRVNGIAASLRRWVRPLLAQSGPAEMVLPIVRFRSEADMHCGCGF